MGNRKAAAPRGPPPPGTGGESARPVLREGGWHGRPVGMDAHADSTATTEDPGGDPRSRGTATSASLLAGDGRSSPVDVTFHPVLPAALGEGRPYFPFSGPRSPWRGTTALMVLRTGRLERATVLPSFVRPRPPWRERPPCGPSNDPIAWRGDRPATPHRPRWRDAYAGVPLQYAGHSRPPCRKPVRHSRMRLRPRSMRSAAPSERRGNRRSDRHPLDDGSPGFTHDTRSSAPCGSVRALRPRARRRDPAQRVRAVRSVARVRGFPALSAASRAGMPRIRTPRGG